jgi:hypothetical protein
VFADSIIRAMMEAASTYETSVNFYQTVGRNNPEDSHLHTRRRENLESYTADIEIPHPSRQGENDK